MKGFVLLLVILLSPLYAFSQTNTQEYYLYKIISFEGNFEKEGVKVKIDDGISIEKLRDSDGAIIKFKTPVAVLMHFISKGWEMYHIGNATHGTSCNGTGDISSNAFWIFRKSCSKQEFDDVVEMGIITQN